MEDKAMRRGLSVAAIVLIVISAALLTLTSTNGIMFGLDAMSCGVPFVAAAALPLLAVLLILTQFYTSTDTIEEMLGAIAVRYAQAPPASVVAAEGIIIAYSPMNRSRTIRMIPRNMQTKLTIVSARRLSFRRFPV